MKHYPVLIVGAGPVGLSLAAELHHYGIEFLIIDKRPDHVATSNAAAIHARTLECWHGRPWFQSILTQGIFIKKVLLRVKALCLAVFNFSQLQNTQYPFILSIPQNRTEEILDNYLSQINCSVKRNTQLISFSEESDKIIAQLQTLSQEEPVTANYLIGCDGYHSNIRELTKISYIGTDIKDRFFLVDAKLKVSMKNEFQVFLHSKGILAFFVMPHSVRIVAAVGNDPQYKNAEEPSLEIMNEIIRQRSSLDYEIENIFWQSHFWIHERIAAHFKQNRVFIVGDAAHVHSPAGGQGMNTGIQDAYNLAWKLAYVLKGCSPDSILESYEQERYPVAKDVVRTTAMMMRMVGIRNKLLVFIRNSFVHQIIKVNKVNKALLNKLSELSVGYKKSLFSQGEKMRDFSPGCRMLDCSLNHQNNYFLYDLLNTNRFHLLVFNADHGSREKLLILQGRYIDKIDLHFTESFSDDFHRLYMFKTFALCLVRPDRYIAYLGKHMDELDSFLKKILK